MKNKFNDPDVPVKFGSDALIFCDWIDTTNFVSIGGRGVAKSTVFWRDALNAVCASCRAHPWQSSQNLF